MVENNKIIAFNPNQKKRPKSNFELKAEISVYLKRTGEKFICHWSSTNGDDISEEYIYEIQKNIVDELGGKLQQLTYNALDSYEVCFTIFFYENSGGYFRYIYTPKEIPEDKFLECLYFSTSIYELKKYGTLI